jgi:hypothetical protein
MRAVFDLFDLDGSGDIDRSELSVMLRKLGFEWQGVHVFEAADTNGDGRVDYDEFLACFGQASAVVKGRVKSAKAKAAPAKAAPAKAKAPPAKAKAPPAKAKAAPKKRTAAEAGVATEMASAARPRREGAAGGVQRFVASAAPPPKIARLASSNAGSGVLPSEAFNAAVVTTKAKPAKRIKK